MAKRLLALKPNGGTYCIRSSGPLAVNHNERIKQHELVLLFVETMEVQMRFFKEGLSKGQVGQRPFEMGYRAMYVLNDMLSGKTPQDPITIGLDVCTPENVDRCKAK